MAKKKQEAKKYWRPKPRKIDDRIRQAIDVAGALEGKAIVRTRKTKHDEGKLVELAVAWLNGRIGNKAICDALGRKETSAAGALLTTMGALRRAVLASGLPIGAPKKA